MNKFGKILLITMSLLMCVPINAVEAKQETMVSAVYSKTTRKKPYLKTKTITLTVGESAYNKPITNGKVRYYSLNRKVVKVNKKTGKMKALKKGKATIRVKCSKTKKYRARTLKFYVNVVARPTVHVHTWNVILSKPVSCTENGIVRYGCTCGETKETITKAQGHLRLYGDYGYREATCTEAGYRVQMCRDCMKEVKSIFAPLGHQYGDVPVKDAFEEVVDSYDVTTCKICKQQFTGSDQVAQCAAHGLTVHEDDPLGFAYTTETIDVTVHHDAEYSHQCIRCGAK